MRRIGFFLVALVLAAPATSVFAQTTRLETAYSIYLTGLPVARGSVTIDLSEEGYVATGSAKTSGFIRLISKGDGSMTVRGSFLPNRMITSIFSGRYTSSRREQKIKLSVENGVVKDISLDPPRPDNEKDRVPITKESRANIVDPMSAMLAFIAKGDLLAPESCNRTIPIFDGRYRFNIVLNFARTEKSIQAEGYQGPAIVCRARYVPIAGHRDRETVQQMADNRELFVWLAPVSGTRLLAPIKATVASPIGNFTVEATRFQTTKR
jgi:hypothetical protein